MEKGTPKGHQKAASRCLGTHNIFQYALFRPAAGNVAAGCTTKMMREDNDVGLETYHRVAQVEGMHLN